METKDLRLTENNIIYSDELTSHNKILGIILPTNDPTTMRDKFLKGLPNLTEVAEFSTILINFQDPYTEEEINEVISTIHQYNFKVRYTYNKYNFQKPYVPFNLMREDSAALLPEAQYYLSVDDDVMVLGSSPKIQKTGGRQYLEILHYLISHPQCGLVSTTGTIGRTPPLHYIGPNYKKGINTYIQTGLGLFAKNLNRGGYWLPADTHTLYGAMEDLVAGAWRLSEGYYHAKMNCVRVQHKYQTGTTNNADSSHSTGWDKESILLENNAKYIKDNWCAKYNHKSSFQDAISKELYLSHGGLPIWDEQVSRGLTNYYDPNKEINEIKSEIIRLI